jgi:hypothetical protein
MNKVIIEDFKLRFDHSIKTKIGSNFFFNLNRFHSEYVDTVELFCYFYCNNMKYLRIQGLPQISN